jgi:hypothetical protein
MSDTVLSDVENVAPRPAPPRPDTPAGQEVLLALAGLGALGLAAGLGSGDTTTALRAAPSALMIGMGSLVLTGPALVVGHQFLGLEARPEALAGALARGFAVAGRLALGLAPVMLFFSATSWLWSPVFCALLLGIGGVGFASTARRLREAECGDARGVHRIDGLVLAWTGLAVLIALRIAWDVANFVVAPVL